MDGHGAEAGRCHRDSGKFDWMAHAEKFPACAPRTTATTVASPTPSVFQRGCLYHGVTAQLMRLGSMQSPMNAWHANLGLESLHVRMQRHRANGMAVAEFLESHPKVAYVGTIAAWSPARYHALAEKYSRMAAAAWSALVWPVAVSCKHFYEELEAGSHRDSMQG